MDKVARCSILEKNQLYKLEKTLKEGYSGGEELRRAMNALAGPRAIKDTKEVGLLPSLISPQIQHPCSCLSLPDRTDKYCDKVSKAVPAAQQVGLVLHLLIK